MKSDNIESELLESEKKRFQVTIVPFVLERNNPKTKLHTQRENIKENIEWKLFLSIFTHNRYFSKFRTIYNNMLYTLSIYNKKLYIIHNYTTTLIKLYTYSSYILRFHCRHTFKLKFVSPNSIKCLNMIRHSKVLETSKPTPSFLSPTRNTHTYIKKK